jgi:GntR family transcriptional regulator/MocR family aminotransferase
VLSSERRGALLEWAEDHDGLIVEDDYDSELRLERGAVGSLQGLAPERVCHIGSVSKRLAPGLSLGWVLSPSWLSGALTYEKGTADGGSPALDQLALADFLARGELDRHIRRMRLVYRRRRALLEETLRECLPEARPHGGAVGFYALIYLPGSVNEPALIAAAARQGISLTGLSEHRRATQSAQPGLVLGYGSASEPELAQSIDTLSEIATSIT